MHLSTCTSQPAHFVAFHLNASVEVQHAGLGAKGGMQKAHLLQLKAAGDTWNAQGMAATPHLLDKHGEVAIPPTFGQNLLKAAGAAGAEKEPGSMPR